jgi:hypothetical protein
MKVAYQIANHIADISNLIIAYQDWDEKYWFCLDMVSKLPPLYDELSFAELMEENREEMGRNLASGL